MRASKTAVLLLLALGIASPMRAQDELRPVATLKFADGSTVALTSWKLTYEFAAWKQKENISTAKTQVRENANLVLGKKSIPVRGDSLALTLVEANDSVRVTVFTFKKAGEIKMENPSREVLAPDLDKNMLYQPRSVDISGETLSGIKRSFCVASFSVLVDCGLTKSTRVVQIDFN